MKQSDPKQETAIQHLRAGQLGYATSLCREILQARPDDPVALYIMGIYSHRNGNPEEAIQLLRRSLGVDPDNFDAQHYLAMTLCEQGQIENAITHLQKALEINPQDEAAHYNLGNIFCIRGDIDTAIEHYQTAIRYKPDYLEAYHNLGNALQVKGAYFEALAQYTKAVSINPSVQEVHVNMGLVYNGLKEYEESAKSYIRALAINPNNDNTHFLLGTAYLLLDKNQLAQKHFERALEINPDNAAAHCNLGYAFVQQLELGAAMTAFKRTLDRDAGCAEAYYGMAKVISRLGQPEKAISLLREALRTRPGYVEAYQSLLMHLHYSSEATAEQIYREHLAFAAAYEQPLSHGLQAHTNACTGRRKLRIGYMSPDFRRHSVAYFIEPVLAHHDRGKYEIHLYHNNWREDDISEKLKGLVDHWHNISSFSDEKVSELVRNDRIDILVDLAGHTFGNRLLVFARRPAPVQVNWIGYPGTTGLSSMDYRITDHFTDPVGVADSLHTEKLIRLPECFSTYRPPSEVPLAVSELPADKNGFITFGSFNSFSKVNHEVIERWAEILALVPTARLVLKHDHLSASAIVAATQKLFLDNGIEQARLTLLGRKPTYLEHMTCYHDIDIALDTFPYNGATTTCEALWMGVPVVVLKGDAHASRVGYSLLKNIGYPELIARNPDEYVGRAVQLARDTDTLRKYRTELRNRLSGSPLTDAERLTKNLEQEFQRMWDRWCRNVKQEDARTN